jgi:ABC-type proline/glycine betaine transport system ATPase subunit
VVLVHGLGGSGKSSLLRRFRAMADGERTANGIT